MRALISLIVLCTTLSVSTQDFPRVVKTGYAKYDIVFSEAQQNAVNEFQANNKKLTLLIDDDYGANIDGDIEAYMEQGLMQHRYAAWGDFNKDSFGDFMLVYVYADASENSYHPKGYVYNLVIFEGYENESYTPTTIHKERSGIIDGITYDKANNVIIFSNFDVAGGSIEWLDKKYKVTEMIGD